MSYVYRSHDGLEARRVAVARPPMGPGFSAEIAEKTYRLDGVASSFGDPGDDWFRWEAYDEEGKLIAKCTLPGY